MDKKDTKKLALNKNTTKNIKVKSEVKTGYPARSGGGGSATGTGSATC